MKLLASTGFACALFMLLPGALASQSPTRHDILHSDKVDILSKRFRFYNRHFPEIAFAHVKGGEDWQEDLGAVITLLGQNATNLDYQHPPELAQDIMIVNLERLRIMLRGNLVSASLYQSGKDGPLHGKPLCVITLNPDSYVTNSRAALGYMIDLPEELLSRVDSTRLLDADDHLRFTVDHEAYHCLESYHLGGAPMTYDQYGGEFNLYRRESGADAYALAMFRKDINQSDNYSRNIMLVRSLWMFSESPNRGTIDVMQEIMAIPKAELKEKSAKQVFELASTVRDRAINDYQEYVRQMAARFKAIRVLGFSPEAFGKQWSSIEHLETRAEDVDYRVKRYRYYLDRLFDKEPIKFLPTNPATFP